MKPEVFSQDLWDVWIGDERLPDHLGVELHRERANDTILVHYHPMRVKAPDRILVYLLVRRHGAYQRLAQLSEGKITAYKDGARLEFDISTGLGTWHAPGTRLDGGW